MLSGDVVVGRSVVVEGKAVLEGQVERAAEEQRIEALMIQDDAARKRVERSEIIIERKLPLVTARKILIHASLIIQALEIRGRARAGADADQHVPSVGRSAENEIAVGRDVDVVIACDQSCEIVIAVEGAGEEDIAGAVAEGVLHAAEGLARGGRSIAGDVSTAVGVASEVAVAVGGEGEQGIVRIGSSER